MKNKLSSYIVLKYQKLRKSYYMKLNFLFQNLQLPPEPPTRRLPTPDPRSLCPQLNLLNPPEQNSWVRHWRVLQGW